MVREIDLVELMHGFPVFGLRRETNAKLARRDVTAMEDLYADMLGEPLDETSARSYVVTEGDTHCPDDEFRVFVGGEAMIPDLERVWIESGLFAHLVVRPKLGRAWPPAIREARDYFFEQWLPVSGHRFRGIDFEVHSKESRGKTPRLHLYFGVEPVHAAGTPVSHDTAASF
ncbi:GyrI-like domain-containing protein [Nigerium massiliense]|uniref:GyrI-like domain-containing protein n=1 Tax=Nigerium massiliense TaxID=1522317 RepID=UPI0005912858|nr:GyrI-like domain-containing protein [Nigerium massiliense]